MSKLRVSPELAFPPEAVTETFGMLGARGSGKTNGSRVMAEEMFKAGLPFVVVDPVGSWWGLRTSRDGKSAGLAISILGGEHQDEPIDERAGAAVADVVVAQRPFLILDISTFASEAAKKRFLLDFAVRLYQKNREPLHLFLEEADDYIPQQRRGAGEEAAIEPQLLRAFENIVRRGRARGLGMTMVTQRSAVLNKNVLTQVQTLIAFRTTGPQDRDAIEEWVKYHGQAKEILASIAGLEDGEAWVWSPDFLRKTVRTRFRLSETYDSGRTPKPGESRRPPTARADVDLGPVRAAMAETIERAKQDDPKALRVEIARLRRELVAKLLSAPAEVKRVEVPILKLDVADRLVVAAEKMREVGEREHALAERHQDRADKLVARADAILATLKGGQEKAAAATSVGAQNTRRNIPPVYSKPAQSKAPSRVATESDVPLKKGARAMLVALAQFPGAWLPRGRVAMLACLSPASGTFSDYLSALRTAGYIEDGTAGLLRATDAGCAAAGDVGRPLSSEDLLALWLPKLKAGARRMVAVLYGARETWVTREQLGTAAEISPASGTFSDYLSALRTAGLLDDGAAGMLRISQDLFVGDAA